MAQSYDLIVIGSGPGGYIAAIRAAQLGMKVAVVEREHLAGICSNWGCIPTKALLRTADVMHNAQHAKDYGLVLEGSIKPDIKAIVARSRGIAARMNNGVGFLFKKNKVDIIWGEAKITKPGEIVVGKSTKPVVEPQGPVSEEHAGRGHLHRQAHHRRDRRPPARAAGHRAGRQADLDLFRGDEAGRNAEVAARHGLGRHRHRICELLPHHGCRRHRRRNHEPGHAGRRCGNLHLRQESSFDKQGMKILLEAKVAKIEKGANSVTATIEKKDGSSEKITADRMISAVGVQANIEGIGLEAVGVKTDRGFIVIDGYGKTNVPGIYAIGDVAGPPLLAHKAEHEAVICVEKDPPVCRTSHPMDKLKDPGLHLLQPAGRFGWPDGSQGEGTGPRHPRRPLLVRCQRQGRGAR